jgi:hypothetical protein
MLIEKLSFGQWPFLERESGVLYFVGIVLMDRLIMEGYDVVVIGSFYGQRGSSLCICGFDC